MAYERYFSSLGYKVNSPSHMEWVVKGFQTHTGLKADNVIGPKTKAIMAKTNHKNYCPEVFEPIKPYIPYTDEQVESVLIKGLSGLGTAFNYHSRLNDFDVMHNINHAVLESGWGESKIARDKNNLYGWTAYDNSAYDSATGYKSYEDCIATWSKEYNKLYLESSGGQYRGNNEYCVNVVYASSLVAGINKAFITQNLRDKLLAPIADYSADDEVPDAPDFKFGEGYSNTQINSTRKYKVDPIPLHLMDNAIRVFQNLQKIRYHFGVPVIISSSGNLYRNTNYNNAIGGASGSQHLLANASDTLVVGHSSREVFNWAKDNTDFNGFGIISASWLHLDLREEFWYKEY